MDNQTMLLLGMVKMKHPTADFVELVEVKGFDVVGFIFPFVRALFGATSTKTKILYCVTFFAYPIWSWYMGFNYKKICLETKLKNGWTIAQDEKKAA